MRVPEPPRTSDARENSDFLSNLVRYLRGHKVDALSLTVSDPPTQAEVQSIANKLDEIIGLVDS